MTNNTVLTFYGTNNFINNSADNGGGAIFASDIIVLAFTGTNTFIGNHVNRSDGGAYNNVVLTFSLEPTTSSKTQQKKSGGVISTWRHTTVIFDGINEFIGNLASKYSGGAMCTCLQWNQQLY